jgi:hypothetical protein
MANPGIGFRTAGSLAIEISLHFLQPYVHTILTQLITVPGVQAVTVGSTDAIYPGALLVVAEGVATQQEIITVISFDPVAGTITANFAITHNAGTPITAATFPVQQPTDPFFTQSEILGYIARAQNEFLTRVPCIFQLSIQSVAFGQLIQPTPCQTVEINRVAASSANLALTGLTRASNVVTAVTTNPHALVPGEKFSIIAAPDPSFLGVFKVATVPNSTHFTYSQFEDDATTGASTLGLWLRLYEVSQEELTMQDRSWQNEYLPYLRNWFEDRTGNYQWGVGGKPSSNFPVELLISVRDSDVLALTDGFLVPDLVLHYVKYLAMSWIFDKDGEQRNPKMAKYCRMRFDRGVMATQRWIDGMVSAPQAAMAGAQSRR